MPKLPHSMLMISGALLLAACTQSPGEISRDAKPFDGITEGASISLVGNEPFWGINIEPDGERFSANYSTPENIDGTEFTVSRFAGNNGLGFNGTLNGVAVQITLTPDDCSDGMSDRSYPYLSLIHI